MRLFCFATWMVLAGACSPSVSTAPETPASTAIIVHHLPTSLKEASGLVAVRPETVLVHDDETAIIYEIGLLDGKIVRSFSIGEPALTGDFEGISIIDNLIYLVTSDGLIYETTSDFLETPRTYRVHNTGLGQICEIEGITPGGVDGLLLVCKKSARNPERDRLVIYHWSYSEPTTPATLWLDISLKGLVPQPETGAFRPAGLEREALTDCLLVLDSRAGAVLRITIDGLPAGYQPLQSGSHLQAEGIAIMPDGRWIIADEGQSDVPAQLTVYPPPSNLTPEQCSTTFFQQTPFDGR